MTLNDHIEFLQSHELFMRQCRAFLDQSQREIRNAGVEARERYTRPAIERLRRRGY